MHPYSTVEDGRRRIIIVLCAVVGGGLAFGFFGIAAWVGVAIPWWVDSPGLFGGFGLVWWMYDTWGWKVRWLSKVPDYSGKWEGEIRSSYNGGTVTPAHLTIQQTSTRIRVHLRTQTSQSSSTMALAAPGGDGRDELHYSYSNRPGTIAEGSMHPHDGWADLALTRQGSTSLLSGEYETNRHRKTQGQMELRRLQR